MKVGIYVDAENVARCGGYGMKYDVLSRVASLGHGEILRANAYVVVDDEKVKENVNYRQKMFHYHDLLRKFGFKIIKKSVQKYYNEAGEVSLKANADMDLAIDALLQAANLDRVILLTGDGDFVRLITALQNKGCRVEVIGFKNVNRKLKEAADVYLSGFLIPGLLPTSDVKIARGYLTSYDEEKSFGFLRTYIFNDGDLEEKDAFFHFSNTVNCEFHANDVYGSEHHVYEFHHQPSKKREGLLEAFDVTLAYKNVRV